MVYLASLLQETPYPHPLEVYTSDTTRWRYTPDDMILSTVDGFLYLTAFWFEASPKGRKSVLHGIGPLKTGVVGRITQLRKPLHTLLDQDPSVPDTYGWTLMFEHELDGAISKLSETPYDNDSLQFAVMYHVVENETVKHYVRLYYVTHQDGQPPVFEYKNVLLPGSTWILSFTLEKDSILYSRDPDAYRFRIAALPLDLTLPPHSSAAPTIVLHQSEPGDGIRKGLLKEETEEYTGVLCRIYSPVNSTFRVVSLDVHKTEHVFYANVYMVDNASAVTQLSELRNEEVGGKWYLREHLHKEHEVFTDDSIDYIGFADMSQFQHAQKISIPRLSMARSKDGRTIAFPYVQTRFLTLDYIEKPDATDGTEYYEWLQDEIRSYDDNIAGMQLDEKGELLAVWTEANVVYIYKRGTADMQRVAKRTPSLLDKLDLWLDVSIPDEDEDDEELIRRKKEQGLPLDWKLRMAIPISDGEMESSYVSAAKFWSTPLKENYLFIALRNGGVNSYLLDEVEEVKESDFMSFLSGRWNMLIAMMMVVAAFVFNEYQYHV